MKPKPIKSHYIPQFYQRGFISDGAGLIWVYSKNREPKLESVRKTGMGLNLYAFLNGKKELDTTSVEEKLAKLDSDGAAVIHKLEQGLRLSEEDRWILSRFVSVMWRRTAKHKEHAEEMASGMMKKFFEEHDENWLYERLKERVGSESEAMKLFQKHKGELAQIREEYLRNVPSFLFPNNALRESMFERVLYSMDWAYFRSTLDTEFITCDDPVVFNKGTGLKDRGAVIVFPLSRFLLLQGMWTSDYRNQFVQLRDSDVRTFNRWIVSNAHAEVYASKRSKVLAAFVGKWLGAFDNPKSGRSPENKRQEVASSSIIPL